MPDPSAIEIITNRDINPQVIQAIETFRTGRIPKEAIQQHEGKKKKIFTYVSHVWVTRQLNLAIPRLWSYDVQSVSMQPDGSATAVGKLTIKYPLKDGTFLEQSITEVGSFDAGGGTISQSNMLASAASRALCRCVMRAFGVGAEFYEEAPEMTNKQAWGILRRLAGEHGIEEAKLVALLKAAGISGELLLDRFPEAYQLLMTQIQAQTPTEEIPDSLKGG